jgi:hypothetical protein
MKNSFFALLAVLLASPAYATSTLYADPSTGFVGIGTTSPQFPLDAVVSGTGISPWAGAFGFQATSLAATGSTYFRFGKDYTNTNNSAQLSFYYAGSGSSSNYFSLSLAGSNNLLNVLGSGKVGIGTTNPAQALEVNGEVQVDSWAAASATTVCKNGNVLATCSSSIRYKEDVKPLDMGLNQVMRMEPVKFKWKGRDEADFGLVAEDMHRIDPLLVTYEKGEIEGVKYPQLTAILVHAVQEQQAEINDLKQKVGELTTARRSVGTSP